MAGNLTKQEYIDYIKLMLTADVLDLEISDQTIGRYVDAAVKELQRYITESKLITVPYATCIDLKDWEYSSIVGVYRTQGFTGDNTEGSGTSQVDPMYYQTMNAFTNGGTTFNLRNYIYNYMSYNTLMQVRSNMSTDLNYKEDRHEEKLYINSNYDRPVAVTIEYIPIFKSCEEIKSAYWIDILQRLSLALVKIGLGRLKTRYKDRNANWEQDGELMLTEGTTELTNLREVLRVNSDYFLPLD